MHVTVLAKAPRPGRVKTRLTPPCTPEEAASIAAASLADTLAAVRDCGASRRIVVLDGAPGDWLPEGFEVVSQSSGDLGARLEAAWTRVGGPGVQIGMDTPDVQASDLDRALAGLDSREAVLGPARDGGWWAIGFRAYVPGAFRDVLWSDASTGLAQLRRLHELALTVGRLELRRDIDTFDDALAIARAAPHLRTAAVVRAVVSAHRPGA